MKVGVPSWQNCARECSTYEDNDAKTGCLGWVYDPNTGRCYGKTLWQTGLIRGHSSLFTGSVLRTETENYPSCVDQNIDYWDNSGGIDMGVVSVSDYEECNEACEILYAAGNN